MTRARLRLLLPAMCFCLLASRALAEEQPDPGPKLTLDQRRELRAAGDAYEAKRRPDEAARSFARVAGFRERAKPLAERLGSEDLASEIRSGHVYHRMASGRYNARLIAKFIEKYGESVYAKAAQHLLDNGLAKGEEGPHPLAYFLTRDESLNRYGYLAAH